jgi:hypothetical protein
MDELIIRGTIVVSSPYVSCTLNGIRPNTVYLNNFGTDLYDFEELTK